VCRHIMLTLSEERKFHLIFAHGSESSREREFQGTRVPGNESSMYGTFAPGSEVRGNESSCYLTTLILPILTSEAIWGGGCNTDFYRHDY